MSRGVKAAAAANIQNTYLTFSGELARALVAARTAETGIQWPSNRWRHDPVSFAWFVLGVELWERQREIANDVVNHDRVAVASGHKTGKSMLIVCLALWYWSTFPDARVIMTSTTANQVEKILWRELRKVMARAGRCVRCKHDDPHGRQIPAPCPHSALFPEQPADKAETGLQTADFREIYGFTARQPEAVAGISGANMLFLPDEASGIHDGIFEVMEGNRAAGAKIVMFSNATRNKGRFFEAFHAKAKFWKLHTISSEETPNVVAGYDVIPGLAGRAWVEEMEEEWGRDSAWFRIRVLGLFAQNEEGRPFGHTTLAEAALRHETADATGRLYLGVDPAGEGEGADEQGFAGVRGSKQVFGHCRHRLSLEGMAIEVKGLCAEYSRTSDTELPVVTYDAEGPIGYDFGPVLRKTLKGVAEVVGIRGSLPATRKPQAYKNTAAEVVAACEAWIKKERGGILDDAKMHAGLHAWEWFTDIKNRSYVDKKKVKESIGRSPDLADALMLATWRPVPMAEPSPQEAQRTHGARTAANAMPAALRPDYGRSHAQSGSGSGGLSPWSR